MFRAALRQGHGHHVFMPKTQCTSIIFIVAGEYRNLVPIYAGYVARVLRDTLEWPSRLPHCVCDNELSMPTIVDYDAVVYWLQQPVSLMTKSDAASCRRLCTRESGADHWSLSYFPLH